MNAGVYGLEERLYDLLKERAKYNVPPLLGGPLAKIIAEEVSKAHKPTVAYLGPEYSFTWEAATRMFPHGSHLPARSITEVFKMVEGGEASYGVVPFINSLEGPVGEAVDGLATYDVRIVSMGELKITLCLAKRGQPRVVYTHPHAAAQARRVLQLLGAEVVYTQSTSEAVKKFADCDNCAVVASPKALEGVEKLCGVEDAESYTRFAVLSREAGVGRRAALIFAVPNVPGALYKALGPIAKRGLNMTLIYSRPTKLSPWDYFFLVELEAGAGFEEAVEELRQYTNILKLAGRYDVVPL